VFHPQQPLATKCFVSNTLFAIYGGRGNSQEAAFQLLRIGRPKTWGFWLIAERIGGESTFDFSLVYRQAGEQYCSNSSFSCANGLEHFMLTTRRSLRRTHRGGKPNMEMMHPSLTMVIVTSPESYSLVAMVAIGIVGMAVGILILEAIAYYIIGFLMRAK
jgi:hypothetical protein